MKKAKLDKYMDIATYDKKGLGEDFEEFKKQLAATESISVYGITSSMEASEISIVNIEGKEVIYRNMEASNDINFDLSKVQSGVYFVKVAHKYGLDTIKFIKE